MDGPALPYRGGAQSGCLSILLLMAAVVFLWKGLDPSSLTEESGRYARLLALLAGWQVAGVAPVLMGIGGWMLFETVRAGGRLSDGDAARVEPGGLHTHWNTLAGPWSWSEIADVEIAEHANRRHLVKVRVGTLIVHLRSGKRKRIRGISLDPDTQEKFLAAARERIAAAR